MMFIEVDSNSDSKFGYILEGLVFLIGISYLIGVFLVLALGIEMYGIIPTVGLLVLYLAFSSLVLRILPYKKVTYSGSADETVTNQISEKQTDETVTITNNYEKYSFIITTGIDENVMDNAKGTWREVLPGQSVLFKRKNDSLYVESENQQKSLTGDRFLTDDPDETINCVVFSEDKFVKIKRDLRIRQNILTKHFITVDTDPFFKFNINPNLSSKTQGETQ